MNFLRSLISVDSSWPFTLSTSHSSYRGSPYFQFYSCVRSTDNQPFSALVFDKQRFPDKLAIPRLLIQRLKILRHPNLLKYIDSTESQTQIQIVIEECLPLDEFRSNHAEEFSRSADDPLSLRVLGLWSVCQGLSWLNNDCKMVHGTLHAGSIFVTKSGEFKLGGLEHSAKFGDAGNVGSGQDHALAWSHYERSATLPAHYRSPEFTSASGPQDYSKFEGSLNYPVHYLDSWCFGALSFDLFSRSPFTAPAQLTQLQHIPQSFQSDYKKLLSTNPSSRLNPSKLISPDLCRLFSSSELIRSVSFLDTVAIQSQEEKNDFFSRFHNDLKTRAASFPPSLLKYRLLPTLVQSVQFGLAGSVGPSFSALLQSCLAIGKLLEPDEFQEHVTPLLLKLFQSQDRAVRIQLLSSLGDFAAILPDRLINDSLWPQLVPGFSDPSSPQLRELSVKSLPLLIARLNSSNVDAALRLCSKLQFDVEPAIRTNVVYGVAKLAPHLSGPTRERTLVTTFLQALKDVFPPARIAALLGATVTSEFISEVELGRRLLPLAAPLAVDEAKEVREAAIKFLTGATARLARFNEELNSSGMKPSEAIESRAGQNQSAPAIDSLVSGIGSYFTSKIIGSNESAPAPKPINSATSPRSASSAAPSTSASSAAFSSAAVPSSAPAPLSSPPASSSKSSAFDAWDDDFSSPADDSSDPLPVAALSTKRTDKEKSASVSGSKAKPIRSEKPVISSAKQTSSSALDDFSWDSLAIDSTSKPAPKPVATTKSSSTSSGSGRKPMVKAAAIEVPESVNVTASSSSSAPKVDDWDEFI